MLERPRFDIFAGSVDSGACWIEAVSGLASAREQMDALGNEKPGKYSPFSTVSYEVVAMTDTTKA